MALRALGVRRETKPGRYGDGGGLYLKVNDAAHKSWQFRYMLDGKSHWMGLGPYPDVSVAEAREKAAEQRRRLREGIDPRGHRDATRAAEQQARAHTFSAAVREYLADHEAGWRSAKHRVQWRRSLAADVEPMIGKLPVEAIGTAQVRQVLKAIWQTKPETASRIRGRIERVLGFAIAHGWREGPNPALWRGHLQTMLPAVRKLRPARHYAALDWREAPAFLARLRGQDGMGAAALQFAILTAARSGEVRGATWDEIGDLEKAEWTIPAARMKAGKEHRVPLSQPALDLLRSVELMRSPGGLVFPGPRLRQTMTDKALIYPLERLGRGDLTVHGFRSTFRDWAADNGKPADAAERALAHVIGNPTRGAYERTDLFDARRGLMDDWAAFLTQPPAEVEPLRREMASIA